MTAVLTALDDALEDNPLLEGSVDSVVPVTEENLLLENDELVATGGVGTMLAVVVAGTIPTVLV